MASSPIRNNQKITTRLPRTPFGSGQNLHTEYNGVREATTIPEIRLQPVVIPPNIVEIDQIAELSEATLEEIGASRLWQLLRESQKENEELRERLKQDGFLPIYNKKHFLKRINYFVNRINNSEMNRRSEDTGKKPFSLLMIDLDHFSAVNNKNGHLVGDDVLTAVAETVRSMLRKNDEVFRYGGEEIAVILPDTDRKQAFKVAMKIREAIESANIIVPKDEINDHGETEYEAFQVTASIGVEEHIKEQSAEQLIEKADQNLYKAKENGRNMVVGEGNGH